jgi:hypothetical protein
LINGIATASWAAGFSLLFIVDGIFVQSIKLMVFYFYFREKLAIEFFSALVLQRQIHLLGKSF